MSLSNTITSAQKAAPATSNHGTTLPITVTGAMDVDQRPTASTEPNKAMNVTTKSPHTQPPPRPPTATPSTSEDVVKSEPQPVLERPRQDVPDSSSAAEAPPGQKAPPPAPPPQTSHFSRNLLSVFSLDPLAASVARFDPLTGDKINKMRKSYEGQLKQLGLSGKNKSVRHAEAIMTGGAKGMMGLIEMSQWPEQEWYNQKVHGKLIPEIVPDSWMEEKLGKAFQLQPGPVPEGSKWEDILGLEKKPAMENAKMRKDSKTNGQAPAAGLAKQGAAAVPDEPIRARRNTKKRRYDDGSFEGYGEGFVDDDLENEAGYESGETFTSRNSRGSKGEKGQGPKRRKTKDFTNSPTGHGASRTPSFAGVYGRRTDA